MVASAALLAILASWAERDPDRPAICAPGRSPLGYRRLLEQIEAVHAALRELGYGRGDRLVMALPNGPEAVVAFLALASHGLCCPIDPALTEREVAGYLELVGPAAVVLLPGQGAVPRAVARERGLSVLELVPGPSGPAGVARLAGERRGRDPAPEAGGYSLLLPTSGSTGPPKLVPLRAATMLAGAEASRRAYRLGPDDCRLNVMPLHHIQGLVGSVLATLVAGGRVVCAPAFDPRAVLRWLDEYEVTWFSGSPTMHASLLAAAAGAVRRTGRRLRFMRSGSAPLPVDLIRRLEAQWEVPLIESYGMTEAHQIASNPLPPGVRRPGTVGMPTGSEVSVRVGDRAAAPGEVGEILVRGPNVISEYLSSSHPGPSEPDRFVDGWLRTGDVGFRDADGYLTLTGRLTEIINRGGDKVQPREVDAVLEEHPAVAQAVAFGVAHPTLGQEVAAAVVLRAGAQVGAGDLERFAAGRLAPYKWPRRVVTVPALPTHGTGKVRRNRLAEELGMTFEAATRPPEANRTSAPGSAVEAALTGIWAQALNVASIGVDDDFFESGGDSLSGVRLLDSVMQIFGVEIHPMSMYDTTNTVARMAAYIEARQADRG